VVIIPWEETENEIRHRISDPNKYEDFRRKDIDNGVSLVLGKVKDTDNWEPQAIRFSKDNFSMERAQKWVQDHPDVGKVLMLDMEYKSAIPLQVTKTFEKEGKYFVEGYVSTPDIDSEDDIISEKALKEAESQLVKPPYNKIYINHKTNEIAIGKVILARFDNKGLFVRAELNGTHAKFNEVWDSLQKGFLDSFSIGFKIINAFKKSVSGKMIRVIDRIKLFEASLVSNPANPFAIITSIFTKSLDNYFYDDTMSEQTKSAPPGPIIWPPAPPAPSPALAPEDGESPATMQQLKQQISDLSQEVENLKEKVAKIEELIADTQSEGKYVIDELKKIISMKSKKPLIDSEHKETSKDRVAQKILFG